MGDRNPGGLSDVVKLLGDKQPGSIKEIVKVLVELVVKLDAFASEMKTEVGKVAGSYAEIRTEVTEACESMTQMNEVFEEFRTDVEGFRKEIAELKSQNACFLREKEQLNLQLKAARREIIELKQYSRSTNLEIKGLPVVEKEELRERVQAIATCLGTTVADGDIDVVHRVPSKDKNVPNVIVRFCSRSARDKLIAASRKTKLNCTMLGFETDDPVYINEHLCVETKILLGKARAVRKEKGWKFIWVDHGKILMRRTENSRVLHVQREEDLASVS